MWFLCAQVFWRAVVGVGVFGCKSSTDTWQKSFRVLVTRPWFPQAQQYQQTLLQQQMLAQQRAQQVQSPEYITSPQDLAPALISSPRSLPVHGGRVADPPYPTNRWELWLSWAWGLLVAYITSFVVSTARSFSQKLLALVVRDYLELDSGCSVIKDILGAKWEYLLTHEPSTIS